MTTSITNADSVSNSTAPHVVAALDSINGSINLERLGVLARDNIPTPQVPVTYELTTDPTLLQQYYKIREACYREDLGLEGFSGDEDEYDSCIVVARRGWRVLGGGRLIVSTPSARLRLPLEEDGFLLKDLFPELNLEKASYCELARFAVDPQYREDEVRRELLRSLLEEAERRGCRYQFSVEPVVQARFYRMIGRQIGRLHVVKPDIVVPYKPIYKHLNERKICLSVTYFHPEEYYNLVKTSKESDVAAENSVLETII